jgi:hypothetical protein
MWMDKGKRGVKEEKGLTDRRRKRATKLVEVVRSREREAGSEQRTFLMPTLRDQLDGRQPIYRLAERVP